jgi:cellulose binding protein with CBM2 domain
VLKRMRTRRARRGRAPRTRRDLTLRAALAGFSALVIAFVAVLATQTPANALTVSGTPSPVTGNATHFDGLGSPYGGCGMPQAYLDSQNFVALNVFNTPGNYGSFPRPVPAADSSILGMFDNGLNCGRWVQVTIGNYCTGTNDGAQNEPFCRNGSWVADQYNGATLTMLVADSCADSNAWCRDDPYHLDLVTSSINQFVLNGAPVGNLLNKWNNRQITWQFVAAPNYSGDINIGFLQGAQPYWGAIAVSHLANGIHGVQYFSNGAWQTAAMDSDMGQAYITSPTTTAGTTFEIRVIDSNDQLINGGRVYTFTLPSSCGSSCGPAYTPVSYTTSSGTGPSTSPSASASSTPSASPSGTPTGASGAACSVTDSLTSSWSTGYQLAFTVASTGTGGTSSWNVSFSLPAGETIASSWNATVTQSGTSVNAASVSYNGSLAPGASTSWGMVVNGASQALTGLTCSAH